MAKTKAKAKKATKVATTTGRLIGLKVSTAEHAAIKKRANAVTNGNVSAYIRQAALGYKA
jgi:hypothetical protein